MSTQAASDKLNAAKAEYAAALADLSPAVQATYGLPPIEWQGKIDRVHTAKARLELIQGVAGDAITVASLPSAATAGVGARAIVTDAATALAAGIGATVAGGGANVSPVYSDGTNWKQG